MKLTWSLVLCTIPRQAQCSNVGDPVHLHVSGPIPSLPDDTQVYDEAKYLCGFSMNTIGQIELTRGIGKLRLCRENEASTFFDLALMVGEHPTAIVRGLEEIGVQTHVLIIGCRAIGRDGNCPIPQINCMWRE